MKGGGRNFSELLLIYKTNK